jgi:hypothetical protein
MFEVIKGHSGGKNRRKKATSNTYAEWKVDLIELLLQGVE